MSAVNTASLGTPRQRLRIDRDPEIAGEKDLLALLKKLGLENLLGDFSEQTGAQFG